MAEMDLTSEKVVPVYLEEEMQKSYIDYAMSVIVQRALPDVRDGMKPVHRRILYAMQEAGMTSTKPYKKSARIVGEVLGKFHPHGDASVYDAIVRLAQDFNTRYMLADGHGNFGSVDGDSPAAMRYTEVRMSKVAESMLEDIDKDTVDFVPNYDESLKEPTVLPSKIPAILVNGSAGIAVGMATNIPPHNLTEVAKGLEMLIDNPDVDLDQLMTAIKGPDFPTGAMILGTEGIRQAYATGRGVVKIKSKTNFEDIPKSNGRKRIVVTEIPYQVNKARLIENIAELVKDGTLEGISDIRDESDRRGMRVVIDLKMGMVPDVILNNLMKHTALQTSFGIINLALVNNQPCVLSLKQILVHYLDHQKEVITRRSRFELAKAQDRAHILEGFKIALDHIDAIIATIRASQTAEIAKNSLCEKFALSERQAQAILDMKLQRLTGLERQKIDDEYVDVMETIDWLEGVLADEKKVLGIIKEEMAEVVKRFGDERRTEIVGMALDMNPEDYIADGDIVVTVSQKGYIKRQSLENFRNQKRGGMGKVGGRSKEDDESQHLVLARNKQDILFFTNKGKVYRKRGWEIPEASRTAKGTPLINILELSPDESITTLIPVKEFSENMFMFMATNRGTVKKTNLSEFKAIRRVGMIAITLDEDEKEELIAVKLTDGANEILLATHEGMSIHFEETDVRPMGRPSHGVRGITLREGDYVVSMDCVKDVECDVLTVTENGLGKRTSITEYKKQKRGGVGLKNINKNAKTGAVVGMRIISPDQEILMITADGIIIRYDANMRSTGRNTQGVKVMTLAEGDKVVTLAAVQYDEASETVEEQPQEKKDTEQKDLFKE
ncbi:MAG: DNA gyrase subunit A [Acidaminococcaceae bacterium]|nr:DNA gyrase subunit A [Acidaminococcaceae bacterium]